MPAMIWTPLWTVKLLMTSFFVTCSLTTRAASYSTSDPAIMRLMMWSVVSLSNSRCVMLYSLYKIDEGRKGAILRLNYTIE